MDYEVASYLVGECKGEVSDLIVDYSNDDIVLSYERLAQKGMILNYEYSTIKSDPGCVKRAHQAGLQMVAWTIDTEDVMLELMALGVDYFNTNRPDLLIKLKGMTFVEK